MAWPPRNRDPKTTSAFPSSSGPITVGYSSGSYSRSASWTITNGNVTSAKPVRSAAPLPWLTACMHHAYPGIGDPIELVAGAVGRAVVDDDELAHERRRRARALTIVAHRAALVEARHHDRQASLGTLIHGGTS